MREIKFRGYNGREWIYSSTTHSKVVGKRFCDFMPNFKNHDCRILDINTWERVDIVTQYTGCNDKNGVEIYEGDIVKTSEHSLVVVVWHDNGFKYKYKFKKSYKDEGSWIETKFLEIGRSTEDKRWGDEVVGNIFENPEMVEIK
ncbi:YopX family protein [Metaclostridioides mangenotii]|uniref:YopX family protein n=1 Tax=Metaclostridioides mangenotii TaxID=1540 RepID=UPI0028EA4087|nr:YopX family protein [Clostridioides mangenotii]